MAKCLKFLALNLERLIREHRLKQTQLAKDVGVSPPYISQLLGQENEGPNLTTLETIARRFGTSVSKLLADPDITVEEHSIVECARRTFEYIEKMEKRKQPKLPSAHTPALNVADKSTKD